MQNYIIDMLLCVMVYMILVYFMLTLIRRGRSGNDGEDNGEGGLPIESPPDIDLPPGICLPDGTRPKGKPFKKDEIADELLV